MNYNYDKDNSRLGHFSVFIALALEHLDTCHFFTMRYETVQSMLRQRCIHKLHHDALLTHGVISFNLHLYGED
jgi:hypothetical protein